MKIKNQYEYQFPSYALCALFYDDLDGLNDEEIANFKRFMDQNKNIDVWEDKEPDQEELSFLDGIEDKKEDKKED